MPSIRGGARRGDQIAINKHRIRIVRIVCQIGRERFFQVKRSALTGGTHGDSWLSHRTAAYACGGDGAGDDGLRAVCLFLVGPSRAPANRIPMAMRR